MDKNNTSFFASNAGKWTITAISIAVIWGLMLLFISIGQVWCTLLVAIPCVYFGWRIIDKFNFDFILIMPVVGWILLYFIKFLLSLVIGFFVAPFALGKMVADKVREQK